MPAAAIVTLIGVALTVAALAAFLVHVAWMLRHASFTLGEIIAGLRAIADKTEPLGPVLEEVNRDLAETKAALDGLLEAKLGAEEAERRKPSTAG